MCTENSSNLNRRYIDISSHLRIVYTRLDWYKADFFKLIQSQIGKTQYFEQPLSKAWSGKNINKNIKKINFKRWRISLQENYKIR